MRAHVYDAVTDHVRATAPDQLPELLALYADLRPARPAAEHARWYAELPDQAPLRAAARRARALVAGLPPGPGPGHALALRHARVIEGFYAYHGRDGDQDHDDHHDHDHGDHGHDRDPGDPDAIGGPDGSLPLMAEDAIWWHEHTGHRFVLWSGLAHTAAGAPLTASFPPAAASPVTRWVEGGALRRHFGAGYVSVALMFGHGKTLHTVAPPSPALADAVLSTARPDAYLLDLHAPRPVALHNWFDAPATVRVIGPSYQVERDADFHITGGRLATWFDVLAWVPRVFPPDWLP